MLNRLKTRLSLFWVLQIFGWGGYALDRYLSERVFFPVFVVYILVAFLLTVLLRLVYRWVWVRSASVLTIGLVVLTCSIVAGFLWLIVSDVVFYLAQIRPYPDKHLETYLIDTARYSLTHHKPFLFLSWSALYFGIKYYQDVKRQEHRALQASALAKEAELLMLRYQLNPHFLFNSLNSASALIREDPPRAEKMIHQLSEFLRYSLAGAKVKEIPLREELEAARNYLEVEKIRYEDKLSVHFDITPAAEEFPVPSLLIHPLIENALKYGMQTSPLPLSIELKAETRDETLRLEVNNTGRWVKQELSEQRPPGNGAGVGLQNVQQRLSHAFSKGVKFDVVEDDGWVRAVMEMTRNRKPNE